MNPPARVRIAMLGAFPPQSQGVMDYCGELVQALASRYDVTAIGYRAMYPAFLYPGEARRVDTTKTIPRAPHLQVVHPLTYYNPWTWLRAAFSTRADVFHVQWWSLPLWLVSLVMMLIMRLRGTRVVLTLHNVLPHAGPTGRGRWFVPASRVLCRLADGVVVHSEQNEAQLRQHYRLPEAKIHRVPHGIFFSKVQRLDPAESKRALGLDDDQAVILLYGALRAYKGIDVLLRALPHVARVHPGVQVVIAGKSWIDWAPLDHLVNDAGLADRVHVFPDFVPEERVPVFFSAADVVVLPYTAFDAQSGVAATALPYRKPMIVSRAGGLPECVGHDERFIVEPGDVEGLAHRLITYFEDESTHRAAFDAVATRVLASLSWDAVVDAHAAVYQPGEQSGGPSSEPPSEDVRVSR